MRQRGIFRVLFVFSYLGVHGDGDGGGGCGGVRHAAEMQGGAGNEGGRVRIAADVLPPLACQGRETGRL